MFSKILIANRGEIACRIARACRSLGVGSVAVHSDADARALHVRVADEAVHIGPPPAAASYLNVGRLIAAAQQTGCQAIHPGYGFLSENSRFAQAVVDAGLVFIGPPAAAIQRMGNKTTARELMGAAGVSILPGAPVASHSPLALRELAEPVGYPLLVKAAGGGGGRGMRRVASADELEEAVASARAEARAAFGDDAVYLERYVARPRHIEVQVLADARGSIAHLFERECSIQRRHQKIIEESPSAFLSPAGRAAIIQAALDAARAASYVNAGTVEFIIDERAQAYFLEMNTRLQVEHPVTELVTGIDLVQAQIRIAAGARLAEVIPGPGPSAASGHAIECRICAEDPSDRFLPSTGRIEHWSEPRGDGVRVDAGYAAGDEVSVHYDSLLAKLIVHGDTRNEAIARMLLALSEFDVRGVTTNLAFLRDAIAHPAFRRGETTTDYIETRLPDWQPPAPRHAAAHAPAAMPNPWRSRSRFRVGESAHAGVRRLGAADEPAPASRAAPRTPATRHGHHAGAVEAPMPGIVRQVLAEPGQIVTRGVTLAVMEAMKMELRVTAPRDGVVRRVRCAAGQVVNRGDVLIELD